MRIDYLDEPELEFGGGGRHIDIRFGIMDHGPLDRSTETARERIHVGIVGTTESVEGFAAWIDRCRFGVDAKASKQPNLFPRFPGFGPGEVLQADIVTDSRLQRSISEKVFQPLYEAKENNVVVREATSIFLGELEALVEKATPDVLVCAVPFKLLEKMWAEPEEDGHHDDDGADTEEDIHLDFHDVLKARAMKLRRPLQIMLPGTYDEGKRLRQKSRDAARLPQDEATRAWNLYAGLYYKSGGTPWRLLRDASQLTVCYIGVSFYNTLDRSALMTSSAQVFNERGEGIILRGGMVAISKEDRQPHLSENAARDLLHDALQAYRGEHKTMPARVFLQKTSPFNLEELTGFRAALLSANIETFDCVNVRHAYTRLFRYGQYPPLRGTFLSKDERDHVLYTRGSVDFFETYPGMYVPRPFSFTCADTEQTPKFLAEEILSLTKMNWNNTQFDNADPIVVTAARRVGDILKNLPAEDEVQMRYSFYM